MSAVSVWQQMAAFDTGEPFVVTAVAVAALYILNQIGSHFTFISDSQTVSIVFPVCPQSRVCWHLAPLGGGWINPAPSPSCCPLTTLFEITVSVVEVARPLRGPGAGPSLEVRLCWPRLGRPLRVAAAVGLWVWRQTVHIPAIPRTEESQGHSPSLPLK